MERRLRTQKHTCRSDREAEQSDKREPYRVRRIQQVSSRAPDKPGGDDTNSDLIATQNTLRSANEALESRVAERTAALQDADRRKDEFLAQLQYRASHDALTGLVNRSALHDGLNQLIAHAKRADERLAVLYLDLDRFKVVNDSLGHTSGDKLLMCVAERLKACVRQSDVVARLGGDEFAVVLADTAHVMAASSVAQKILQAIEKPVTFAAHELVTSASIGACVYPDDGRDADSLLKNADIAMYRKSKTGAPVSASTPKPSTE